MIQTSLVQNYYIFPTTIVDRAFELTTMNCQAGAPRIGKCCQVCDNLAYYTKVNETTRPSL